MYFSFTRTRGKKLEFSSTEIKDVNVTPETRLIIISKQNQEEQCFATKQPFVRCRRSNSDTRGSIMVEYIVLVTRGNENGGKPLQFWQIVTRETREERHWSTSKSCLSKRTRGENTNCESDTVYCRAYSVGVLVWTVSRGRRRGVQCSVYSACRRSINLPAEPI